MQTVKCPLCDAGLKVIYKNETFEGWKRCNSCGQPSYVIAREEVPASAISLKALIRDLKTKLTTSKALDYILRKREVSPSDLYFEVGMKAKQDMKVLEGFRVVMKVGSNYVITPGLERFVGEEIQEYLPPKRRWYEELMH